MGRILIKNRIKHDVLENSAKDYIQGTSICTVEWGDSITISSEYYPPQFTISTEQFVSFSNTLGKRCIVTAISTRDRDQSHLSAKPCELPFWHNEEYKKTDYLHKLVLI